MGPEGDDSDQRATDQGALQRCGGAELGRPPGSNAGTGGFGLEVA